MFAADFAAHFHDIVTVFLITQARATNIPLFAIFRFQHRLLNFMDLSNLEITITCLLMQYTSFFALGGSNSIASIDLSNAYNGVSSYNVIMVGILTFMNNWSGPIWWVSATYYLFRSDQRRVSERGPRGHIEAQTLFAAVAVLGVMVACTVLRTHLFIWTVFSPKFLYSAAWALGQHVVVNLVWGEGFLRWMYD
jgi:ethanolaminephosphotransferase